MKRALLAPAILPVAALDELKQWLAITTSRDDESLMALLRTALDAFEGFTRAMPIEAQCEEVLPATRGWHKLATAPVQAITAAEILGLDGSRITFDPGDYLFDITADGCGRVNLLKSVVDTRIIVQFTAGLAPDWEALPDAIRHGVIRLAAHNYREQNEGGAHRSPPAAITALWQPWRRIALT